MSPKANKAVAVELPAASPLGYTVEETARILRVGRTTVLRFAAQGLLELKKVAGTRHRITEKSLRKFLHEAIR